MDPKEHPTPPRVNIFLLLAPTGTVPWHSPHFIDGPKQLTQGHTDLEELATQPWPSLSLHSLGAWGEGQDGLPGEAPGGSSSTRAEMCKGTRGWGALARVGRIEAVPTGGAVTLAWHAVNLLAGRPAPRWAEDGHASFLSEAGRPKPVWSLEEDVLGM